MLRTSLAIIVCLVASCSLGCITGQAMQSAQVLPKGEHEAVVSPGIVGWQGEFGGIGWHPGAVQGRIGVGLGKGWELGALILNPTFTLYGKKAIPGLPQGQAASVLVGMAPPTMWFPMAQATGFWGVRLRKVDDLTFSLTTLVMVGPTNDAAPAWEASVGMGGSIAYTFRHRSFGLRPEFSVFVPLRGKLETVPFLMGYSHFDLPTAKIGLGFLFGPDVSRRGRPAAP